VDCIKFYMYFDKEAFCLKFDEELENLETMTLGEVIPSEMVKIQSEEQLEYLR
jgi:hypothetical protein